MLLFIVVVIVVIVGLFFFQEHLLSNNTHSLTHAPQQQAISEPSTPMTTKQLTEASPDGRIKPCPREEASSPTVEVRRGRARATSASNYMAMMVNAGDTNV